MFLTVKSNKYTQIRVVHSKDPTQFEELFNQAQVELQSMKPETTKMEFTPDGIVAIIQFEKEENHPENAQDEMDLHKCFLQDICEWVTPVGGMK